jgi:3-phenylpropionate/cinnamic acid dioxygenase small subunit
MPGDEEHVRDPISDRIIDRIVELICAYAERLDGGDLDGVAALFERGTFRSARGGEPLVGRDAVRRQYDPVLIYDDATPRTKHILGNIEVAVDDDAGTATSRCTFTVLQQAPGADLRAVLAGRYHDSFERGDDGWYFVERVVHPDLVGDLSEHMGSRQMGSRQMGSRQMGRR